jgi:hypothetical protein
LTRLLTDPKVIKLFHFGRFDIAAMLAAFGVRTSPVWCTKVASKLIRTYTDRHGLKYLVQEYAGVDVSKAQQTSDWGSAKLTDAQRAPNEQPLVVVAPSWGPHCLFESCGEAVVEALLATGAAVIARPHPMTRKHTGASIDKLAERFAGDPNFSLEENVASQDSLQRADLMVSDWSGAALEFAFGTERPVLFIDVPRKINNPGYEELGIDPFEATVREQIGKVVAPDNAEQIAGAVAELVGDRDGWVGSIRSAREANIYNVGRSGAVAADVIAEKADRYLQR